MRTTRTYFFALPLLLTAAATLADELLEDQPATRGNLTITLPKGWKLNDRGGSRNVLLARAPASDKDLSSTFSALFSIDTQTVTKLDGAAQQARLAKQYDTYKPTEKPTPITINGVEGVMFGGTFSSGSVKLRSRQYMLLQANRVYVLTFTTLESAWQTHALAIEACAASLMIKPEK